MNAGKEKKKMPTLCSVGVSNGLAKKGQKRTSEETKNKNKRETTLWFVCSMLLSLKNEKE